MNQPSQDRLRRRKIPAWIWRQAFLSILSACSILGVLIPNRGGAIAFQSVIPSWRRTTPPHSQQNRLLLKNTNTRLFDSETAEVDVSMMHFATIIPHEVVSTTFHTDLDIPRPTINGGFTHTNSSRAKISAANKGKTPWNKGKERSPEVKASIAAGVRANNRMRFLEKLAGMGLTEEEYENIQNQERLAKAEKANARRTENGGYRPTDETKKKLSEKLKAKWASGEMKAREVDPNKARRGFTHSDETKAKIAESLKKKWADDPDYRDHQVNKASRVNNMTNTREKISETLKNKWQDPEFRDMMLDKIRSRKKPDGEIRDASYRAKISDAMKARWQDPEYRSKTVAAIRQRSQQAMSNRTSSRPATIRTVKVKVPKVKKEISSVKPINIHKVGTNVVKQKQERRKVVVKSVVAPVTKKDKVTTTYEESTNVRVTKSSKKEPDGSINRLREERRDLFDLLYGDDPEDEDVDSEIALGVQSGNFGLEDADLNAFDPYGLEDH